MRKYLYAGAIAGGLLLLGAAPAYADTNVPDPANGQSTGSADGLLGPGGVVDLNGPLSHAQVLNVKPGSNSPDVTGAAGGLLSKTQGQSADQLPAARTGLGQAGDAASSLPAADVVRGVLPGTADTEGLPGGLGGGGLGGGLGGLPIVGGLLGGGLPVVGGGGLPVGGGGLPVGGGGLPIGGGGTQESGLLPSDLPLLGGGLGGLLPFAMPQTVPAFNGMPAGGTAVGDQSAAKPTKKPAVHKQQDPATAGDARVHEEPVDTEGDGRQFSAGRPVSGVDPDFK